MSPSPSQNEVEISRVCSCPPSPHAFILALSQRRGGQESAPLGRGIAEARKRGRRGGQESAPLGRGIAEARKRGRVIKNA